MSTRTIYSGELLTMDPSDELFYSMDWDSLPLGETIASHVMTITVDKQNGATILTKDNETVDIGGRATRFRLLATTATVGDKYHVSDKVILASSPSQKVERSFVVKVENL